MYDYGSMVDDDLSSYILNVFNSNIETFHNLVESQHKFGSLTESQDYDDTKLLKRDLSNLDPSREHTQFPYETVILSSNNVIMDGLYRKWDNGILEYDIVFKVGYYGETVDINGTEYNVISANNLVLENPDFYLSSDDAEIFNNKEYNTLKINDMYQVGLNSFSNSYSGRITFQQPFLDKNYMVFHGDVVSQERDTSTPTIDTGANSMTFTNKNESYLDAIYVVYPKTKDVRNFGLVSNSFHCHIVGRWK